jgi:hypothetical protein
VRADRAHDQRLAVAGRLGDLIAADAARAAGCRRRPSARALPSVSATMRLIVSVVVPGRRATILIGAPSCALAGPIARAARADENPPSAASTSRRRGIAQLEG